MSRKKLVGEIELEIDVLRDLLNEFFDYHLSMEDTLEVAKEFGYHEPTNCMLFEEILLKHFTINGINSLWLDLAQKNKNFLDDYNNKWYDNDFRLDNEKEEIILVHPDFHDDDLMVFWDNEIWPKLTIQDKLDIYYKYK